LKRRPHYRPIVVVEHKNFMKIIDFINEALAIEADGVPAI
jgi:hypothetical protein